MTILDEITATPLELSDAMAWQHKHSERSGTAYCGRVPLGRFVNVFLVNGETQKVIVTGLQRCDSANVCVACSQRIGSNRRQVTEQVFSQARASGFEIGMLTLTVRHKNGDDLGTLLNVMQEAYENLRSSQAFKVLRRDHAAEFLRVTEVTHGANGWHPHFHVAVVYRPGFDWDKYAPMLTNIWCEAVERHGLEAPLPERAFHLIETAGAKDLAWYLSKAEGSLAASGTSAEVAAGRWKRGRGQGVSVWQLLGLAMRGDLVAEALWHEYEHAVKSRRFFNPSRTFAATFGLTWRAENEDSAELLEVMADRALSGEFDADNQQLRRPTVVWLGVMKRGTWQAVQRRGLLGEFLRIAPGGRGAVNEWLRSQRIFGFLADPSPLVDEVDPDTFSADEWAEWFHHNEAAQAGLGVLARMAA